MLVGSPNTNKNRVGPIDYLLREVGAEIGVVHLLVQTSDKDLIEEK